MKHRSQTMLKRLHAASNRASTTANKTRTSWRVNKSRIWEHAKRRRDKLLYSNRPFPMKEPFQQDWFDDYGYPLTSQDPLTDRFVNPWNSESTNGWKRIKDVWRWKKTRMLGMDPDMLETSKNNAGSVHVDDEESNFDRITNSCVPEKLKLTWIGHATSLLQVSDKFKVLMDPVFSHKADKLLIEEIRCANIAFEANLDNSEDQTLVVNIFSFGIQFK